MTYMRHGIYVHSKCFEASSLRGDLQPIIPEPWDTNTEHKRGGGGGRDGRNAAQPLSAYLCVILISIFESGVGAANPKEPATRQSAPEGKSNRC